MPKGLLGVEAGQALGSFYQPGRCCREIGPTAGNGLAAYPEPVREDGGGDHLVLGHLSLQLLVRGLHEQW